MRYAQLALPASIAVLVPSVVLAQTPEVIRILESGKNVVTPLGWFYPFKSADTAEVEAACRKAGVTLHGTGIHPGGNVTPVGDGASGNERGMLARMTRNLRSSAKLATAANSGQASSATPARRHKKLLVGVMGRKLIGNLLLWSSN